MKMNFHSDNGAPCARCGGTIYTYTVDDQVTYVGAVCIGCRCDNMFYPPRTCSLDTAAFVSAAHRESRCSAQTLLDNQLESLLKQHGISVILQRLTKLTGTTYRGDEDDDCHEHVWNPDVDGVVVCQNCGVEQEV